MDPTNMDEALDWAVKIEEKLCALGLLYNSNGHGRNLPNYPQKINTYPKHNPHPVTHKNILTPSYHLHQTPNNPRNTNPNTYHPISNRNPTHDTTRRLTDWEFQDRKLKGLCFRCDEKWRVGNMCKKKELSVLIVGDGEEEEGVIEEEDEQGDDKELGPVGIPLNSVVGIDNPRTMKLEGKIKGSKVVVMIDPGATHNFISPKIVRQLGIRVEPTEEFGVMLGTGETLYKHPYSCFIDQSHQTQSLLFYPYQLYQVKENSRD